MDAIPFIRFIGAIIIFGLAFYFLAITATNFMGLIPFEGTYAGILLKLWGILPGVVLLFSGVRLVMVMQKRG